MRRRAVHKRRREDVAPVEIAASTAWRKGGQGEPPRPVRGTRTTRRVPLHVRPVRRWPLAASYTSERGLVVTARVADVLSFPTDAVERQRLPRERSGCRRGRVGRPRSGRAARAGAGATEGD